VSEPHVVKPPHGTVEVRGGVRIRIRRSRAEDFDALAPLVTQLFADPSLDVSFIKRIYLRGVRSGDTIYVCAERDGRVVGFAACSVTGSLRDAAVLGRIDTVVVEAAQRRMGIGTALINHLIRAAQRRGCRRVELASPFRNPDAHSYYRERGFDASEYVFSKTFRERVG
jgi:GNAT superfamily N-acetyltransferase